MIFSYFKQQKFASIFLLLAMLFVTVTHSHEYSPDVSIVEQLDCNLCQQSVELPKTHVVPTEVRFGYFSAIKIGLKKHTSYDSNYHEGSPRAPPTIT